MRLGVGNGGWVRVDDDERLPGSLYVRLRPDGAGRWRTTDLYLDGDRVISGEDLRRLPLAAVEQLATDPDVHAALRVRADLPAVPIDVLASHYASTFTRRARGWVADAYRSHFPDSGVPPVKPARGRPGHQPEPPPLRAPQGGRLTDEFLAQVHRAYSAAVARGEWPAPALAAQTGVSVAAVRKWVYTARQRGIMPPGRQGVVS